MGEGEGATGLSDNGLRYLEAGAASNLKPFIGRIEIIPSTLQSLLRTDLLIKENYTG